MPPTPPGKIMFTLQKQTEDVKSKKVTDNGQTPLLVHFDKKQDAAGAMQVLVAAHGIFFYQYCRKYCTYRVGVPVE